MEGRGVKNLFQSFVVDEACSIFGYLELLLLDMLAKLPRKASGVSLIVLGSKASCRSRLAQLDDNDTTGPGGVHKSKTYILNGKQERTERGSFGALKKRCANDAQTWKAGLGVEES